MSAGVVTWTSLQNSTLYTCGCLIITATSPATLVRYCGQPDCLRLFAANVAYTQAQFNWQTAHGGTPTLVAALQRTMVTPLPQILPPPPTGYYFGAEAGTQAGVQAQAQL